MIQPHWGAGHSDRGPVRLRTFGPGTVVGEMAVYTHGKRSADVVADTPCMAWRLTDEYIRMMEERHPRLANEFHSFVVRLMASRLSAANEEIRALL